MRLDTTTLIGRLSMAFERKQVQAEGGELRPEAQREGLRVSLSALASARAVSSSKNRDIDDSDLPEAIKDLLRQIRELQGLIAQKQAALQALSNDQGLDPLRRRLLLEGAQAELTALQAALSGLSAMLVNAMRMQGLSGAQLQAVASLLVA